MGGDQRAVEAEFAAAPVEDGVEVVERFEPAVGDRFIDERPEVFGRLQLGCVGRQVDEPQSIGNGETGSGVPSGAVEDQDDDASGAGADRAGEVGQQPLEERLADAVRQIPDALAAGRLDEGGDVEPLIAVMAEGDRPFADRGPDTAADRLQPEPMLVRRPDLDRCVRVGCGFFGERVGEVFLKAAASSGLAECGFFGRGSCNDHSSFFSASQPRGA